MVMLTDLGDAFDAAGVPWVPVGPSSLDPTGAADWTTRGRPASTGGFEPSGVLCHHTASPAGTTPQADLNVILAGNGAAPGPISQLYIGRDAQLYVVAAGRANHGGSGIRPGLDGDCADMNFHLVGIEAGNNGVGEPWPDAQIDLYGRTVAALAAWYGWDLGAVYLHATTGPPSGGCNSKIDPAGPWLLQPDLVGSTTWHLETWRDYCSNFLEGNPPEPIPGDDEMATPCGFITCAAGTTGHHVDGTPYTCPVDGTTFKVNAGGTIQWVHAGELDDTEAVLRAAGARTDTWQGYVGAPDTFGRLVGDKPG